MITNWKVQHKDGWQSEGKTLDEALDWFVYHFMVHPDKLVDEVAIKGVKEPEYAGEGIISVSQQVELLKEYAARKTKPLPESEIEKIERSFPLIKFGFIRYPDKMNQTELTVEIAELSQKHQVVWSYKSEFYDGMVITDREVSQEVYEDIFHAIWEDEMLAHGGFTANHEFKLGYQCVRITLLGE